MKDFEYYFEIAAQDFGMALLYAAMALIFITLLVRAYRHDRSMYGFLNDSLNEEPSVTEEPHAKATTNPGTAEKHGKEFQHWGHMHAEA